MSEPLKMLMCGKDFETCDDVVYIYHPGSPKGTMRPHRVVNGAMVEIPWGWAISTASVASDATTSLSAREKDYGI